MKAWKGGSGADARLLKDQERGLQTIGRDKGPEEKKRTNGSQTAKQKKKNSDTLQHQGRQSQSKKKKERNDQRKKRSENPRRVPRKWGKPGIQGLGPETTSTTVRNLRLNSKVKRVPRGTKRGPAYS